MNSKIILTLGIGSLAGALAGASEVKIFRLDSAEELRGGELDGVALDPLGVLELASRLERLTSIDEPFVFAAAAHGDGWVLGTGNSGKLLEVSGDGAVAALHAFDETAVFAVWSDEQGVYAGSSPLGSVMRLGGDGAPEVVFDPEESYVWDLARAADGRLLVATGLQGHLYAVDRRGRAEHLFDSGDSHIRAIEALPDGRTLVGTAGQGLIVELGPRGRVRTLFDAIQPEILDFAPAPDGDVYVAALASEASLVDLARTRPAGADAGSGEAIAVVMEGRETVGSRSSGATGPRSVVLRLDPAGSVEEVVSFDKETIHALLWHAGTLWIGTGEEGRLYRLKGDRVVLERQLEERQIVALAPGRGGPGLVTTNAAALYRLPGGLEGEGLYTSPVLDAEQVARFGSFYWQGEAPRGTAMEIAFRSGMSLDPDATWSDWTVADGGGSEIPLERLPRARYVQWRARLSSTDGRSPALVTAELSYRQQNLRPRIEGLEAMEPGKILVPNNFNPASQTFEPWSPNHEGIFTSVRPAPENGDGRLKDLWKKGYRTLRWQASDPNGDDLRFDLSFRPEGDDDGGWLPMVEDLDDKHYSFDQTVLPDGVYRFRLRAVDQRGRQAPEALSSDRISESVVVDNTPPRLVEVESRREGVAVTLEDAFNPIREVAYSVDAGEWRPAPATDGLLDGRREVLDLPIPEGARMLLLRATDAAHNSVTLDLLPEL